jgi:hypothetical protein
MSVGLESMKNSGQSMGGRSDKAEGRQSMEGDEWKKWRGRRTNKPTAGANSRMWRRIRS